MAEEFQAGLCGGNRWSLPKNMLIGGGSSPCSSADLGCGSYGSWLVTDVVDHLKPKSSPRNDSTNIINNFSLPNHSSLVYEDSHHQVTDNSDHNLNFHVLGFGNLSSCSPSSSSDWTCQTLFRRNLSPKEDLSLDQRLNVRQTTACESLSYGDTSNKIQGLLEVDLQPQQAVFSESTINYSTPTSYGTTLNELSPAWSKLGPFIKAPPSTEEQKSIDGGLHFTNNTTFWNASASASTNYIRGSSFVQPNNSQPQFVMTTYDEKPNCSPVSSKPNKEQDPDPKSMVRKEIEPAMKRARIETPSRLPTFKVRKEKLGDRITALQQLVSPFGKTDTASVLHEAIGCIKFLHDQVSVLSTPYMKNGDPMQNLQIEKQEPEGLKQDLRSRGLCLVPISNTYPVAHDTTPDIWTPTFGATFR